MKQKRYNELKQKKRLTIRQQCELENIILDVQRIENIFESDAVEWLDKNLIDY